MLGGGSGHIDIAYKDITSSGFVGFDQNWSNPLHCTIENHTYKNVLGWLHPKNIEPTPPTPTEITTKKKFPWFIVYRKLRNQKRR